MTNVQILIRRLLNISRVHQSFFNDHFYNW